MTADSARAQRVRRASEAATRFAAVAQLASQTQGRQAGLTLHSVDASVLGLLRVHGPLTPRELARLAQVSSSGTITGAIDRLERAGWTTRTPCQIDRRKVFITLTDTASDDSRPDIVDALDRYTDDQLAIISEFLEEVSAPPTHDS